MPGWGACGGRSKNHMPALLSDLTYCIQLADWIIVILIDISMMSSYWEIKCWPVMTGSGETPKGEPDR